MADKVAPLWERWLAEVPGLTPAEREVAKKRLIEEFPDEARRLGALALEGPAQRRVYKLIGKRLTIVDEFRLLLGIPPPSLWGWPWGQPQDQPQDQPQGQPQDQPQDKPQDKPQDQPQEPLMTEIPFYSMPPAEIRPSNSGAHLRRRNVCSGVAQAL
ncbi:hypothetical protein Vafri_4545 [Volvox africanus]|uniref:Uncharacterized protein n=1 Tax=Volvox africanus TaxID=51714 RepID=A0A8J4AUI9_9CHLO|nr:hypothetical protein Vafri_4545 [Volvox africanus]